MNPTTVRVDVNVCGGWEVALSDETDRVACKTLEEARQVARRTAADRRPYELIVRDAYHRVLQHELVSDSQAR